MPNLLLNDTDAAALLWAVENTIADQGEWFEQHWPSEYGAGWLGRAVEIRLNLERLRLMLVERAWPDWKRAERAAKDAGDLAAQILAKCALDADRMRAKSAEEAASGAA
jgi:hypothetical protein